MKQQSFNKKTGRWVKFDLKDIDGDGDLDFIPLDNKQRNPTIPFNNVPFYKKKRR